VQQLQAINVLFHCRIANSVALLEISASGMPSVAFSTLFRRPGVQTQGIVGRKFEAGVGREPWSRDTRKDLP
jgi:hypothetical protein